MDDEGQTKEDATAKAAKNERGHREPSSSWDSKLRSSFGEVERDCGCREFGSSPSVGSGELRPSSSSLDGLRRTVRSGDACFWSICNAGESAGKEMESDMERDRAWRVGLFREDALSRSVSLFGLDGIGS